MARLLVTPTLLLLLLHRAPADALFGTDPLSRPSRSYDALHYRIEIQLDDERKRVIGRTTISLIPLVSALDSVLLHAVDLDVSSVKDGSGRTLRFRNTGNELTAYLHRPRSFADTVVLVVEYTTTPARGLYFWRPDSNNPHRPSQVWTQGEDMDNRHWFPCWDFPNDRATSEVIATVRDSWTLLSNGKLVSVKHDRANRTKTFHWSQSKPHVSYLIMLAAGEYEIVTESYRNIPLQYYLYKNRVEDGKRSLAATPRAMKYFEEATGFPYPWEKFAQIYITDFMWGGMENTSAVTLNESFLIDQNGLLDFTGDDVVAHELAHQWFGDLVTCRDWSELWLNEGFANYFEALFKRADKGLDEFQLDMMQQAAGIFETERMQGRKPIVGKNSFATNLYSKGAWVLYMLHNLVGEKEFFRAVKHYLDRNAFTSVSSYDFIRAVEEATGQNLDWFFDQWLFKAGYPHLSVTQRWNDTTGTLLLGLRQEQEMDSLTGVFILPMDIECTTAHGKTLQKLWMTTRDTTLAIRLPEAPRMVIVDRGMKVLKRLTFEKSSKEWIYQLLHAEDIVDRMAAAKALKAFPGDTAVYEALRYSALNDPFWAVRREATIYLGTMNHGGVKEAMFRIAGDEKSSVRAAAVVALEKFPSQDVSRFLQDVLQSDSSYMVRASCLESLGEVDSAAALRLALQYVDRESYRGILRRAALRVLRALKRPEALTVAVRYARPGNPSDIRAIALSILGEEGENDSLARSLVFKYTEDSNSTIRRTAVRTLAQWGGGEVKEFLTRRRDAESDPDVRKAIESALEDIDR